MMEPSHTLEVWLHAAHAGTLALLEGRMTFAYRDDFLSRPDATALSVSLPLRAERFDDRTARPFFAGLLPEGALRRRLAQRLQISRENDFALLDRIGGECAGAVTFLDPGEVPPPHSRPDDVQWLSEHEVIALLAELPHRPMLAGEDGLRLSLAGAQDKLPVVFDGTRLGLPRRGTASSHILKPAIPAVEASVANEGFCMALAGDLELQPAKTTRHRLGEREFLLVERYDRLIDPAGFRRRLHQEDFCQALGVVPDLKYQSEGGPDLATCFDLVRRVTHPSAPQVLSLLDRVIFNALIGNHDAHAKNFSLLYVEGTARLAPLYDILSTAVYPTLTPKMAMKIGSKYRFSELHARHWDAFADAVGLSKAQARRYVLEFARTMPVAARALLSDPRRGFATTPIVERIVDVIEARCALTVRRLTEAT